VPWRSHGSASLGLNGSAGSRDSGKTQLKNGTLVPSAVIA
jgi:hypothetical protein